MKVIAAVAVAVSLSGASPAWAGKTAPITEGTLRTRDGAEVIAVPLEHTEVKVRVDGFIADVEVDQRFSNPYKHKIEATYLFPLPAQSAVDGYELVTGGRTIKGEIKLKDDAKAVYTAARTRGYVAALLTQERPNLFSQAVANIEPGATVDVKLHYVQALGYDDGAYELVFPMVAGPRFVPKTSKVEPAAVQPPVMPAGMRSGHDIGLSVEIDAGVPIKNVVSPSHQVEIATRSAHETRAKIGAHDTIPNKDFVLRYEVAGDKPEFAVVPHRAGGAGSFFFMAQPPVHPDAAQVTPKEMVFVIDTSSSMQGRPLAKAKEAIGKALQTMHPDDTFQIVRFDDTASALGTRPIANKPKNVQIALDWLAKLDAGGGTDMTTGIKAALAFPHDKARLRIVVFLTDGFIGNEDEILALVQDKLGDSRLFSFGVGSSVNRYLLEEMAAIGRGTVQVVRPDEDTAAAVGRLARRIASPLLTDIAIDWKGLAVDGVTPARIPDLFAGQPLVLAGRYAKAGNATVTVRGKLAGRPVTFDVPVSLPETRDRPAIAAIWARGKITELTRRQLKAEQPAIKQQIIDLALANHLMSAYTSFVAVDTSKVTAGGKAQTVAVPVEVPDGLHSTQANYGGSGSGIIYGGVGGGVAAGIAIKPGDLAPAEYHAMGRASIDGDEGGGFGKHKLAEGKPDAALDVDDAKPRKMAKADLKRDIDAVPIASAPIQKSPPRPDAMKASPKPDTSVVAMRKDIDRCWASGAIKVVVTFDDAGTASKIVVSGGDAACVQAAAKNWRRAASKNLSLGFSKE